MRATQVPIGRWALRMAALVAVVAMFTRTSQAEVVSRSLLVVHIAADRDEAAALQAVLRDVVFGQRRLGLGQPQRNAHLAQHRALALSPAHRDPRRRPDS